MEKIVCFSKMEAVCLQEHRDRFPNGVARSKYGMLLHSPSVGLGVLLTIIVGLVRPKHKQCHRLDVEVRTLNAHNKRTIGICRD